MRAHTFCGFCFAALAIRGMYPVPTKERVEYVHALRASVLDFFEYPVMVDDLEGMAKIAAATDIAIGWDEGVHATEEFGAPPRIPGSAWRDSKGGKSLMKSVAGTGFIVKITQLPAAVFFPDTIEAESGEGIADARDGKRGAS